MKTRKLEDIKKIYWNTKDKTNLKKKYRLKRSEGGEKKEEEGNKEEEEEEQRM